MSFSLDSLKGSLSFPLGFHCLLAASSAGQITARYLHFECIWEGSTVSCTALDPSTEKREVLSAPGRWQESDRRAAGALNVCQCISHPMGFVSWIPVLYLGGRCCPGCPVRRACRHANNPQVFHQLSWIQHYPLLICGVLKWSGRWLKAIVCRVKVLVDNTLMCREAEEGSLWDCCWMWDMTAVMDFFVWKFKCLLNPSHA